jgi:hypothetical protein
MLVWRNWPEERIEDYLEDGAADCGRDLQPTEVSDAITSAIRFVGGHSPERRQFHRAHPHRAPIQKWPAVNQEKIEKLLLRYDDIDQSTFARLPWNQTGSAASPCHILRWAFNRDEYVCIGTDKWKFGTWTRGEAISRSIFAQFIVPNPFKARTGLTKAGKPTTKSDSQVLTRRFVVIEFDFVGLPWMEDWLPERKLRAQLQIHYALAFKWPLALLVFSGNKSNHGWYVTNKRELLVEAAELGADTHLWVPSQFTRMPGGHHANGHRQSVLYFRPISYGTEKETTQGQ